MTQILCPSDFDDCIYMALLSALEQTRCTFIACDSKWVTQLFVACFEYSPKWCTLQHYLVVTWLVPCRTVAILAHSVYTTQLCTMSHCHITSHKATQVGCMCCNLPHALLAEWPKSFTCYCGNTCVEQISVTLEKKILPLLMWGLKPATFRSRVWCSNHWVSLL